MKVILLGTAAGGGFPQWNCACPTCANPDLAPRTQDGLAVSADGNSWYLVNASPDIRAQILATPELAAGPGRRDSPLRGVLLTDAELDHTLGLLMLREGNGLEVHGPPAVLEALTHDFPVRPITQRYGDWSWGNTAIPGLRIKTFAVSNKTPKYASKPAEVIAYRFEDPSTGGILVYAPCLADWPEGFDEFVDGATYVVLDGTFWGSSEMGAAQSAMGHLPITASLEKIRKVSAAQPGTAWAYTHLNNTNPVLDPQGPEYAEIRAAGVKLPPDGTRLDL